MTIRLFDEIENRDRRLFIKGLGSVSLATIATLTLGGCETLLEQIRTRPLRRRLRNGSAEVDNDIAIYADAVSQMKSLPASDPRSWAAQAGIHGQVIGGFNFCQHGTDHFFSWHRAYLYYFERICRELTGETDWGLPYWNWNQDPLMHPQFTDPSGSLDHPRNITDLSGFSAFEDATLDPMFDEPDFFAFGSQIEGTPHNSAHSIIGQDMVTGGSPLDPIFWMHHNMVDYCWWKWNIELNNSLPSDSVWQQTSWSHFVDENGDAAEMSALGTALMPIFSFRFEESDIGTVSAASSIASVAGDAPAPGPVQSAPAAAGDLDVLEERIRRGAIIRTDVLQRVQLTRGAELALARPLSLSTNVTASTLAQQFAVRGDGERVFLRIEHTHLPDRNDFFVRVFLNRPDAGVRTPTSDPHFAGTFAFFGTMEDHRGRAEGPHGKTEFLVNVSDTIERLSRAGRLREQNRVSVQLVAVPIGSARAQRPLSGTLMIRDVDLTLSRVTIEPR